MLEEMLKNSMKNILISFLNGRLSQKIIDIIFNYIMYHVMKDVGHNTLVGHTNILKIKKHDLVTISSLMNGKSSLVLII